MKKYSQSVYVCQDKLLDDVLVFGSIMALASYLKWPYYKTYYKSNGYDDKYYKITKSKLIRYKKNRKY